MKNSKLFYRYYDALFQHKDYAKETDLIFQLAKKFGLPHPKKILEIGCGTGNHTQELAKKDIPLIAIDIDKKMVALARKKIERMNPSNVRIFATKIDSLPETNFDLVIALFNVVTYLPDPSTLSHFMKGVARRLNPGGIFIFDCWNGIAALRDPPRSKTTRVRQNGADITCTLNAKTDAFSQKTLLTYHLSIHHNNKKETGSYAFTQTLWTPLQIKTALEQASLELLLCAPLMKPSRPARATDWKIMFVVRKVKNLTGFH